MPHLKSMANITSKTGSFRATLLKHLANITSKARSLWATLLTQVNSHITAWKLYNYLIAFDMILKSIICPDSSVWGSSYKCSAQQMYYYRDHFGLKMGIQLATVVIKLPTFISFESFGIISVLVLSFVRLSRFSSMQPSSSQKLSIDFILNLDEQAGKRDINSRNENVRRRSNTAHCDNPLINSAMQMHRVSTKNQNLTTHDNVSNFPIHRNGLEHSASSMSIGRVGISPSGLSREQTHQFFCDFCPRRFAEKGN